MHFSATLHQPPSGRGAPYLRIVAVLLALLSSPANGQQVDYRKADQIRSYDPLLVGGRVYPVYLSDSARFYFVANGSGPDKGTAYLVDPVAGTRTAVADTATLINRRSEGPPWGVRSPDRKWDAFVWNHNVYIRPARLSDADTSKWRPPRASLERQGCDAPSRAGAVIRRDSVALPSGAIALTRDGAGLSGYAFFRFGLEVGQVEAERFRTSPGGLRWSPDSKKLLVKRDDLTGVRIYPMYSSTSNQPIDHRYFYAPPGDSAVPRFQFYIIDVARRTPVRVPLGPIGAIGAVGDARWGSSSDELYVSHSDRGQKHVTISRVNTTTGIPRTIAADSSSTFVDLEDDQWAVADGGNDLFVISERDGWGHLYRYGADGSLKGQLERGAYRVEAIRRVDTGARQLYFMALGREGGNPYHPKLYRVNFDGTGLTLLTPEAGYHTIRAVPRAPFFIDTYSQTDTPPVTVLRSSDGAIVLELARGDATGLRATGWTPAEVFTVKARDGVTDLYGIMHKPGNFDPARRYPVIARVYPGPQQGSASDWVFKGPDNYVGTKVETTRGARTINRVTAGEGMARSVAELGFIVIQLDALGSSPHRSKAFHDFLYGRVGDNGLADYVAGIRQLAARFPWIDTTRVGITGHSGGGYTAAGAMLHYPDFFKVGVSQSGNHDFRVYGWYWGEKYQGLLTRTADSDNFEAEANYKYAQNLKGKLLLTTGDMDCNNPAAETFRLVDALEKAGKDFDFILLTDTGHQPPTYAIRRVWDYLVRNLLGVEPPADYQMITP